jgi:hypothetical protein
VTGAPRASFMIATPFGPHNSLLLGLLGAWQSGGQRAVTLALSGRRAPRQQEGDGSVP